MQLTADTVLDGYRRLPARDLRIAGALRIRIDALIDEAIALEAEIERLDRLTNAKLEAWAYAARRARELSVLAARLERRQAWRAAS